MSNKPVQWFAVLEHVGAVRPGVAEAETGTQTRQKQPIASSAKDQETQCRTCRGSQNQL